MSSVVPINQKTNIEPYTGKLFDFDTNSSNVYLARTINENLIAYGNDCIVDGFSISNTVYSSGSDELSFDLGPGKLIIDLTLIENLTTDSIVIDLTDYVDNTPIYIFADFKYLEVPFKVPLKILTYFQNTGALFPQNTFNSTRSRIILGAFQVTKATSNIQNLVEPNNVVTVTDAGVTYNYEIRPIPEVVKSAIFHLDDKLQGLCLNLA